jgi:putative membrane protein
VILAQMMDWNDHHDGTDWMWVVVALVVVLLIAATVLLARQFAGGGSPGPVHREHDAGVGRAEDVLAERFARGEIDEDEYLRRRAALRD